MRIQSMFQDDINRKINGVVQVDQDESAVLIQELNEYVVTRELKRHFITFFNNYTEALNEETADIGVCKCFGGIRNSPPDCKLKSS